MTQKARVTVVSGPTMKNTMDRLNTLCTKMEEKQNESIARKLINVLKTPVIGKPRAKKDAGN